MPTVTSTSEVGPEGLAALRQPRDGLVNERVVDHDTFTVASGPVHAWHRTLDVTDLTPTRHRVTETIRYRLAIPLWAPLFVLPVNLLLRREHRAATAVRTGAQGGGSGLAIHPFWAPPERFDARASSVLALVCALSLVTGYVGTAITQTVTYAASEFHRSTGAQGVTLAMVRIGVLIAFLITAAADRRGRRKLLLVALYAACGTAVLGALSPDLWGLGFTQALAQGFATGASLLIGVFIAEEVPAGARAWAVGVLAMSTALGAGMCIWVLPVADFGARWWRVIYVVPLLGVPLVAWVGRKLPESQRFTAHQTQTSRHEASQTEAGQSAPDQRDPSQHEAGQGVAAPVAQQPAPRRISASQAHRRRFWLLAIGSFGLALFVAPMFQLQNDFLRHERGFSAAKISLFTILTSTPGGIGILVGGWLADVRGRRIIASIGILGGSLLAVGTWFSHGWPMWGVAMIGSIVAAAAVPAFGVYGPELFPTLLRGRINGLLQVVTVVGSSIGLLLAGWLTDSFHHFGPAMAILLIGPLLVAGLVIVAYPETSGRALEDLNPEDQPSEAGT